MVGLGMVSSGCRPVRFHTAFGGCPTAIGQRLSVNIHRRPFRLFAGRRRSQLTGSGAFTTMPAAAYRNCWARDHLGLHTPWVLGESLLSSRPE